MKKRIRYKNKCIRCNDDFIAKKKTTLHCSKKCAGKTRRYKKIIESGIENEDYIICKWNNIPVGKYMSQYIKDNLPGKTIEDYQNEFPDALISAPAYIEKISKNSGKHMKLDKYKEMFSEKIKGKNNPNHKSNTTKLQRQLCSKYSKEYWYKNFPELNETEVQNKVTEFALKSQINRLTETQLEYWINKGYNEVDAKEKLKERQTTFSKDICIEKHGKEKGLIIFNERQERWSSKMEEMYLNGEYDRAPKSINTSQHSMISCELIDSILLSLDINIKNIKYYNNIELGIRTNEGRIRYFDFTDTLNKKIIEFNGDYWHCNPSLYESTYIHPVKKMTANEIWEYDEEKIKLAESYGYEVLNIWEAEYKKDPDKIIKKCVEFINS